MELLGGQEHRGGFFCGTVGKEGDRSCGMNPPSVFWRARGKLAAASTLSRNNVKLFVPVVASSTTSATLVNIYTFPNAL